MPPPPNSYPEWLSDKEPKQSVARIARIVIDEVKGVPLPDEERCTTCKTNGVDCYKSTNHVNCAYCTWKKLGAPKLCSLNPSSIANPRLSSASRVKSTVNGNSQRIETRNRGMKRPIGRPKKYEAGKFSTLTRISKPKPRQGNSSNRLATAPTTKEVDHSKTLSTALEPFLQHIVDKELDKQLDEKLDEILKESEALKDQIAEAKAAIKRDLEAKLSTKLKTDLRAEMTKFKTKLKAELTTELTTQLRAALDTDPNEQSAEMKDMEKSFAELKEDYNLVIKMVQANDSQVKALTDKVAVLETQIKKPFASYPRC